MSNNPPHRPTNIRNWRKASGLSLDQLAAKARIDKGNLSKLERGLLPYNQELMERLAGVFGTDVESLIGRNPQQDEALFTTLRKATPEQKRMIERLAAAIVNEQK